MIFTEDKNYTLTASSGTATQAVNNNKNRKLVQIFVEPTTASTEYDVAIVDKNSKTIYEVKDWTGKLVDTSNLPFYVYGNFTFRIDNASVDEAFAVILVFAEEAY